MSIATEFNQKVIRGSRRIITARMNRMMANACENIMSSNVVTSLRENQVFYNVTGNLYKSIAAGAYYRGELINIATSPGKSPTRPTLKAGERYDLPQYYGGNKVGKKRAYRAPSDSPSMGGENGERAGEDALEWFSAPRSYTWMLRVVAGVNYASYVENVTGHDFMTNIREYVRRYYRRLGR